MATRTWTGAIDTDLNNPGNYTGAGALLTTDDLVFSSGSVVVTASDNLSVKSITVSNGVVINGGAYLLTLTSTTTCIIIDNSQTFTLNMNLLCIVMAAQSVFITGITDLIWNGTGNITITINNNTTITTYPTVRYTGSGTWTLTCENVVSPSHLFGGNFNIGTADLIVYNDKPGIDLWWQTITYQLNCGDLKFGTTNATAGLAVEFGTSTIFCSSYSSIDYDIGETSILENSATIFCNGNFQYGPNMDVNPGDTWIYITNTSTVILNGNSVSHFNISAGTTSIITLTDFVLINMGGLFQVVRGIVSAGSSYLWFAGSGSIHISTDVTMRLKTNTPGSIINWYTEDKTFTIPVYTANDWGGIINNTVKWISESIGRLYSISAPTEVIVSYMDVSDCNNIGYQIDATNGTNINYGNNYGWLFFNVARSITKNDYFEKNLPAKSEELFNKIVVKTQPLVQGELGEIYLTKEEVGEQLVLPPLLTTIFELEYSSSIAMNAVASFAETPTPSGATIDSAEYYSWGAIIGIKNPGATSGLARVLIKGIPLSVKSEEKVSSEDVDSILLNGLLTYEYPINDLIQTHDMAKDIADSLLLSYKTPRKDIALDWRGDPSIELGDIIQAPEYQRNAVNMQGTFTVYKNKIDFDGTLKEETEGRKIQ